MCVSFLFFLFLALAIEAVCGGPCWRETEGCRETERTAADGGFIGMARSAPDISSPYSPKRDRGRPAREASETDPAT